MVVLGGSYGPPLEDGGMASRRPEPLPRLHMHAQTPISQVSIEIWSARTPTSDRQQQRDQQLHGAGARAEGVLRGESGSARNATLLGAALILKGAGRALTLAEGVDQAVNALDSGAALDVLHRVRELAG